MAYKTAWYICHRIRKAMEEAPEGLFDRTVEVDEDARLRERQAPEAPAVGTKIVMGVLERGQNGGKSATRFSTPSSRAF